MIDVIGGAAEQPRPEQNYEPTGNAAVDEAVDSLEQLEGAPLPAHVQAFEAAHERLRDALADAVDNRV